MLQEDLDNIIILLGRVRNDAQVGMPGAICSTGELLSALIDANRYRWLRDHGHIILFGNADAVDKAVDQEMAKSPAEFPF